MNLFLDCEFNGGFGDLMSMGIVSEDDNQEFYEEVALPEGTVIDPWVAEHVVPLMDGTGQSYSLFQNKLKRWLNKFPEVVVWVDHPADIEYFTRAINFGNGDWMRPKGQSMTFIVHDMISAKKSERPHHALYDAKAQRDSYLAKAGFEE